MLLLPMSFPGCASVTPQENFKDALHHEMGKNIDNSLWAPRKYLIGEKTLSNGNVEYRYQYLRSCQYMFEVEPKSRIIVNTRYEGEEFDCVINP